MAELRLAIPETSIATWSNGETSDVYTDETLTEFLSIETVNDALAFSDAHPMLYGARPGRFRCRDSESVTAYSLMNPRESVALGVLYARELLEVSRRLYVRANAGEGCEQVKPFIERVSPGLPSFDFAYGAQGFQAVSVKMTIGEYARYLQALVTREESAQYSPGEAYTLGWQYAAAPLPEHENNPTPGVKEFFADEAKAMRSGCVTFWHTVASPSGAISYADIADALYSLHLSDVKTIAYHGEENRLAASGIAALWWFALDRMRSGRIFQCAACGKVHYETKRQGPPQRFCCKACKQWRHMHQETDESGNYREWKKPRRNR